MRKIKMNESVPITDVLIDLIGAIGFTTFHLIDFYSVATVSSVANKMVRVFKQFKSMIFTYNFISEYQTYGCSS